MHSIVIPREDLAERGRPHDAHGKVESCEADVAILIARRDSGIREFSKGLDKVLECGEGDVLREKMGSLSYPEVRFVLYEVAVSTQQTESGAAANREGGGGVCMLSFGRLCRCEVGFPESEVE